jgi:hypothetical protein
MSRIGEENVVQMITDDVVNYNAVRQLLMGKRTRLLWIPCVAYCIDLILKDFEKLEVHQITIIKGRRITSF